MQAIQKFWDLQINQLHCENQTYSKGMTSKSFSKNLLSFIVQLESETSFGLHIQRIWAKIRRKYRTYLISIDSASQ